MDAAAPDHTHDAPQLRTLLLTDLCDSTALVERLGDTAAAALFRDHDRLVLELQQRWRGRLIDRSDGLLLLFERPIDGLGFALDYRRGLEDLGKAHDAGQLRARAGLHVGEVLIWRNSDEAVDVGAKQVEVEGLAKPFAARLMQLALPGQILLSAVAEPLVRRAVRELGERADTLKWRSYGRWRFKGVPTPFEIHEVGEAGLAPLRTPRSDAKAWRDVPLWRRPIALVAEVAAVAVLGAGIWLATRVEPALAFNERDWVVVGDLRNLTGQTVLDDSLEQAFRISLEQSRYVNVLSDLKVQDALVQMRLDPAQTAIDRAVASQIAIKEGARAVVLPTVSEVDSRVRFSVEVVDPATQTTVYSEHASGKGLESVLASIDNVAGALRGRLGEALAAISATSAPLPQATTADLDALRAYALAESAVVQGRFREAQDLYETAIRIDPVFARAHLGLATLAWASSNHQVARNHVVDAVRLRENLSPRDQLSIDAWEKEVSPDGNSLSRWLTMARMYPDHFGAHSNASWYLLMENRFDESMQHALSASTAWAPKRAYSLVHAARVHIAQGRAEEAIRLLDQADAAGRASSSGARAEALWLLGRTDDAKAILSQVKSDPAPVMWMLAQRALVSAALAESDHIAAARISERVRDRALTMPDPFSRHFRLTHALVRSAIGDPLSEAEVVTLEKEFRLALNDVDMPARYEEVFRYATLLYVAQRDGHLALSSTGLQWLEPEAERMQNRLVSKISVLVRANQMHLEGKNDEAVALLRPELDGSELVQARVLMVRLARANGDSAMLDEQVEWLTSHRGQAWAEVAVGQLLQPLNVADSTAISGEERAVAFQ
ncbi:putative peptide modification system cyclase [Xanthomonas sp. XNM01]|uniref:putative peptide modification system cyclase n=1 Tax=Xanthomonas sp. XNM01 TaxID=2769289 RepID=UPI001785DB86|nr:putative peptide modification system cyclase [Xanthomonas sp. XNM01]MBD9369844.1 putative peptide modification system cyclase [Xanthomonas sp. XNM01]